MEKIIEMVEFDEDKNEVKLYYCENYSKLRKPGDPYIHPDNIKIKDLFYYDDCGGINFKFEKIREVRNLERISKKKFSRKNNKKFSKYLNRLKGKRRYVFNEEPVNLKLDYYINFKKKLYKIRKLLEWL